MAGLLEPPFVALESPVPRRASASIHRVTHRPSEPLYKGEPLDAARGPGLGCFWIQVAILAVLLVVTPLSVIAAMPDWVSATLLIATLVLLLFTGQTVIFLLRLVAADRREQGRRRPMASRTPTVGQIEDEAWRETGGRDGSGSPPSGVPE